MVVDTACSGGLTALQEAYNAMKLKQCDTALVAGKNLIDHPSTSIIFKNLSLTSPNGYCKPFDDDCNGFVRSEIVQVLLLQRATNAKRIYANIVNIATNSDGFKQEGFSYPSKLRHKELFENFYRDIDVNPKDVHYIEMHGTGTPIGDPVECWSVDQVYNKDRNESLLIGSIKSNMGHSETASACASISKAVLIFESGLIPPNLHFNKPNANIPSLCDGRLKVCTELTPLSGKYCAINSFGAGGSNAHLLLEFWSKFKINNGCPDDKLPRLVLWSGRTKNAIEKMFKHIENNPLDAEFIRLLHDIQKSAVHGHVERGYAVFKYIDYKQSPICIKRSVTKINEHKRKIVWMLSGMGSQSLNLINDLMKIGIFRNSIEKCQIALNEYQFDLLSIIKSSNRNILNDIANSLVTITAIQIGLIDILNELNIPMDFVIGHSLGEIAVAYADNALTLEQTILSSYFRGVISKNSKGIVGKMYAIGVGYNDLKQLLPDKIDCACRNSSTSTTISGPKDEIEQFANELREKQIFVEEIFSDNIPYHSRYVQPLADLLYSDLEKIIPSPKLRSEKWLSTCYAKDKWQQTYAMYASPEYQIKNTINSVIFDDVLQMLPNDAILIEIAPNSIFKSIIKRELPNINYIPLLTKQNGNGELLCFMEALGK